MGHWHSFPALIIDRSYEQSFNLEVTDGVWINAYGRATATVISEGLNLTFQIQGPNNEVYSVSYAASPTANHVDAVNNSWRNLEVVTDHYDVDGFVDRIFITQSKKSTLSGSNPLKWEFRVRLIESDEKYSDVRAWVTPWTTTTSSTITRKLLTAQVDSPTIEVSFIPEGSFQDIASVTFSVNDNKKHGCAEGSYKQLLSTSKTGVQQIYVFAPLVTCYLAGEGDFSTEKMYSVNKIVGPVWPEVFLYAMAKFILNRLLNNVFDMNILYRRHTKKFLEQLRNSEYSNFVRFFDEEQEKERYFLR